MTITDPSTITNPPLPQTQYGMPFPPFCPSFSLSFGSKLNCPSSCHITHPPWRPPAPLVTSARSRASLWFTISHRTSVIHLGLLKGLYWDYDDSQASRGNHSSFERKTPGPGEKYTDWRTVSLTEFPVYRKCNAMKYLHVSEHLFKLHI